MIHSSPLLWVINEINSFVHFFIHEIYFSCCSYLVTHMAKVSEKKKKLKQFDSHK